MCTLTACAARAYGADTCVVAQAREYGEGYETFLMGSPAAAFATQRLSSERANHSAKSVRNVRAHPFHLVLLNQLFLQCTSHADRQALVAKCSTLMTLLPVPYGGHDDPASTEYVERVRVCGHGLRVVCRRFACLTASSLCRRRCLGNPSLRSPAWCTG